MMIIRNNKKIIFSVSLFLIFSCGTHETLAINGKVFLEDPSSNSTDNTFDYQEGDNRITIRSGNTSTTTDSNGSFRLEGDTIEKRTILFEASRPGYQTAYVKAYIRNIQNGEFTTLDFIAAAAIETLIDIFTEDGEEVVIVEAEEEDDGPDAYDLETPLEDSIMLKSGESVQFEQASGSHRNSIDFLKDSEDKIYIFLLKEATSSDWNVFEYAD